MNTKTDKWSRLQEVDAWLREQTGDSNAVRQAVKKV